ncbi:MAG: radical SAM family heme chaperone HemW [Fimbriimonadaceae bacterium]
MSAPAEMSPVAVYVHTPFCPTKCGYCDFNSYAMSGPIVERTVYAIEREIRSSPVAGRPAKTVFFGGGTPTLLEANDLARLLRAVFDTHPPLPDAEVTSEANPGAVDAAKFVAMREAGFNRVSIGAQSFRSDDLVRLGRVHAVDDVGRAVAAARAAGFDNLNLDLMFALPGQSVPAWRRNLDRALALEPEHLSLYCLTLEPNTPFYKEWLRGTLVQPDEEAQIEMYDVAVEATAAAGFALYEISNFARPGRECLHNLCYWRGEDYAGYGPGAVGCLTTGAGRVRTTNVKHPLRYCEAVEADTPLACETDPLSPEDEALERVMLGLRLAEGIAANDPALTDYGMNRAVDQGWAIVKDSRLRLTPTGRRLHHEVVLLVMKA